MAQLGHSLRLTLKPLFGLLLLGQMAVEDLDRHLSVKGGVETTVNHGHSTVAHLFNQLVLQQLSRLGHPASCRLTWMSCSHG